MDLGAGVAIVGMGCRFPGGVYSPADYWDFMLRRGDGIVEMPAERWNTDLFYDPDPDAPGRSYTRHGGFVVMSPWDFDAEFFGISPREAEVMDPQQRWALEVASEALDDAGIAGRVAGRDVGVYLGGFMSDAQIRRHMPSARRAINSHTSTGATLAMVSNRVSHALDLRGPSMTIDTACSSSLVAIHQATRAVTGGECDVAIAGGVNVMIHPEVFVTMCKGRFLARDGRCKPFEAAADGYGRGEGAGMIVLKKVGAALRDGDRIYAVIAGTGVNQDGRTPGITVPNGVAQRDLARAVCASAGLEPHDITYVEAHGTGTPVGDPIELTALGAAYGRVDGRSRPLPVGSVKAAIGHLEAAAGVAGVIKAALAVHHRIAPPQSRFVAPNPAIPFADLNIEVVAEATPIGDGGGRVVAAVNAFGYGGTNAHAILVEAPDAPATPAVAPAVALFPVSGASEQAVRDVAAAMRTTLASAPSVEGLCSAAWSRRAHHQFRTVLPCTDKAELARHLDDVVAGAAPITRASVAAGAGPVFVLSGMGPQWWGMGRELLTAGGAFADKAHEVDAVFTGITGWSILDELSKPEQQSRIPHTAYAQPANFLVQVALVAELAAMGIEPAAVVGHSVGEVSAAYVGGALDLDDALMVSYHRGRLQAGIDGAGGLLAAEMSESQALKWISDVGEIDLAVAAINGPDSVTIAGPSGALERLHRLLEADGVFARRLQVTVPYHSPLMDPILGDLAAALAGITPKIPVRKLYSTVTAAQVTAAEWDAGYWCANVRRPVRFRDTVELLIDDGRRVFLEVGPHPVLSGSIRAILAGRAEPGEAIVTLRRGEGERDNLVRAVGDLYRAGCLGDTAPGRPAVVPHVELPRYPWQHRMLWTEPARAVQERCGDPAEHPMLGGRSELDPMAWSTELAAARLPWLADHAVDGMIVLPAAAYLDAFLSAAAQTTRHASLTVESARFVAPLVVSDHAVPRVSVTVEPATMRVSFASHDDSGVRTVHSTARIVDAPVDAPGYLPPTEFGEEPLGGDEFYALLNQRGLQYGPMFRRVTRAWVGGDGTDDIVVATIDTGLPGAGHIVHPAVLDAVLQCVAALPGLPAGPMVPVAAGTVRWFGPTAGPSATVTVRRRGDGVAADIEVTGRDGSALLELLDVRFGSFAPAPPPLTRLGALFYEMQWRELTAMSTPDMSRGERAVLTVGLGEPPSGFRLPTATLNVHAPQASPLRRWGRRRDAAEHSPMRPARLAEAVGGLGGADATVVVVAGTGDEVTLIADLAEVSRQLDAVSAAHPDVKVDAVVLTSGAFQVPGDTHQPHVLHAALTGARRALQNSQLWVRWRQIDLAPARRVDDWDPHLLNEIHDDDQVADEIAVRRGGLYVPFLHRGLAERLAPYSVAAPQRDPEESFIVVPPAARRLDDVTLQSAPRVAPGPGQIELRIDEVGLNYKDAMKLLGLLTPEHLRGTFFGASIGMEGVAVVVRTGGGTSFAPGDLVLVSVPGMFRRYLTLDAADGFVEKLTHEVAPGFAGSFVPLLTAYYGLECAARLVAGETILVHGAAGGTGLAAVQVARGLGARVIGSASTAERREFAVAAGAHHTVNSRSTRFVDDVLRLTDGRGADVIYTSLPGELLRQNLWAAAEFGRIVDIGKADIFANGAIELGPFNRDLQYFAIDMDRMFALRRGFADGVVHEVVERLDSGRFIPLPATTYPADRLAEALAIVAQGAQRGRVVVALGGSPSVRPGPPRFSVRPDVTYLISGGFGAVGLTIGDWLVDQGARHLVVVSRGGARSMRAAQRLAAWRAAGAQVRSEAVDVGDAAAVTDLVRRAGAGMPPLSGVFHAAGVAEDTAVEAITPETVRRMIDPKLRGAWNLHNATEAAGIDLQAFVMFSSVSAVVGIALQITYAAANAGLNAIAELRHARGKPALAVCLGALGGGGMLTASDAVRRYMDTTGHRLIELSELPGLLDAVAGLADQVPNPVVAELDWKTLLSAHPGSRNSTRFGEFASPGGDGAPGFRAELLALPAEQRLEVLTLVLAEHVGAVLGIPADSLDAHTPLPELGLDSLSAVDLASRVATTLDIRLSAVDFGRLPGLAAIAKQALGGMTAL